MIVKSTDARVSYDRFPQVAVSCPPGSCARGWDEIARELRSSMRSSDDSKRILCVDCYPGVDVGEIVKHLTDRLGLTTVLRSETALLSQDEMERLTSPFLRENDRVFGRPSPMKASELFDRQALHRIREKLSSCDSEIVLLVGFAARHVLEPEMRNHAMIVYADLARWEIQQRFRNNRVGNIGFDNAKASAAEKYQRAFFVDWRIADRWKRETVDDWNYVLDTNAPGDPKLVTSVLFRDALSQTVSRPFRVVPFFDPAPWGGQWMKHVCGLDKSVENYGWCFDCVPEENSLLLDFDGIPFEIPAIDLVFDQPMRLLGKHVFNNFGAEFPIRFDLLDTFQGGNLSFQVHPLTRYIKEQFGISYTQDESYYILDAEEDASVYLGLKEKIVREEMIANLRHAQSGKTPFDADRFVNSFQARKHDHFLIPAGTCHCSGKNALVLEISATPFIFTFKMWDWGRMGLDGRPRPVHVEDGIRNIQWDRTTPWVEKNLINHISPIRSGNDWQEERTGLHELEFIETRRCWFTGKVPHDTGGTVNVLNLVEGAEAVVESPDELFEPFVVHYAETFIVPASVGAYTIRPCGDAVGTKCGTIKAYVRDTYENPWGMENNVDQ